jgi:hypothetical protein
MSAGSADPRRGTRRLNHLLLTARYWFTGQATLADLAEKQIELRGGAADEAPLAYKRLPEVLAAQGDTIRILHTLRPIGVAMAGADTFDPFKD